MYTICIQGVCFLLTIDRAIEIEEARLRERWEATSLTKTRDFGRKGFKGWNYAYRSIVYCVIPYELVHELLHCARLVYFYLAILSRETPLVTVVRRK